jgi:hypothetical protein
MHTGTKMCVLYCTDRRTVNDFHRKVHIRFGLSKTFRRLEVKFFFFFFLKYILEKKQSSIKGFDESQKFFLLKGLKAKFSFSDFCFLFFLLTIG